MKASPDLRRRRAARLVRGMGNAALAILVVAILAALQAAVGGQIPMGAHP